MEVDGKAEAGCRQVCARQASGLVGSRGEAKRLILQGGVKVNEEKADSQDLDVPFDPPVLVQVGKRSFVELI